MQAIIESIEKAMNVFNKFSNVVLFTYSAIILFLGAISLFDSVSKTSSGMIELYDAIWNALAYIVVWLALFGMRAATSLNKTEKS